MKSTTNKAMAKVAAVATGIAMATSMLSFAPMVHAAGLTSAQVQSILSLLSSFGADSSVIANVQASLTGGTPTNTGGTTTGGAATSSCSFSGDLTIGSTGADVTCLQRALLGAGYSIPALSSGTASYGYFGGQTKSAVIAWQKAAGVAPTSGYFGPISRAHWNLGGGTTSGGTTGGDTGGTTTPGAGTGTGLKVSIAATSPVGTVLVEGQGIGDLGEFTFSNPTATPISVTGVTFNRIGVSNDSTMTNVYLYNNGTRITDSAGIQAGQFSYSNASGLFTVPAGMSYTVAVRSDIAKPSSGQQIGVSLVSVSSTGTLDASTSFPINSGYQTISAATLAGVQFQSNVIPNAATTISPQSDYTVWQDSVSVSQNPVKLSSMRFTNLGSADASALSNLRLYVDGTQVGSAVASLMPDRTVTFDMTSNPMLLSTQTHVIKVLANVVGGAARTIMFSIQRSSDAMFIDNQLNQPVTPSVQGSTNFNSVQSQLITINSTGGTNGGVSVNRSPSSPINSVSVGASNVKFASFDMLAAGESTKIRDLNLCVVTSSSTAGLNNGKIMVNGVQVGSSRDIVECSGNPTTSSTDFSLGSSLILPPGQTTTVDVYADAQTAAGVNLSDNETVKITLAAGSSNAEGQSSYTSTSVPTSAQYGNLVTVTNASLLASKSSSYANQSTIAGSNNVRLGALTLSAGSTEDVNVNTIQIGSVSDSGKITNLTLKDNATGNVIGTAIPTPSSSNSFSVNNLTVPMSGTKTIDVYGNVRTNATGSITLNIPTSGVTGTGASTGLSVNSGSGFNLQTIGLGAGTLNVGIGASNPVSSLVIAGAGSLQVGDFTYSAQNTSFTVQKLEVDVASSTAQAITNLTIQYQDVNGVTQTATQALQAHGATSTATFSGLSFYVPMNDSADVSVWVSTPTIQNGGDYLSGKMITVFIPAQTVVSNGFQAVDTAGNAVTTTSTTGNVSSNANAAYGVLVLHKSIPTFAMQTLGSTNLTAGQAIYRVNVTADPAGAIDLDQLSFNVSTSTVNLAGFKLYDVTGGSAVALNTTAVSANGGVVKVKFDALQQVGAGQTKTYELRAATVTGWTTGASVSISLAQDAGYATNNDVNTLKGSNNVVWSDRSATNHASANVSATDWSNGYLLKDFVTDVTSFTHN